MAFESKEIVLITGANTGIGLEIARKTLQDHADRFYCLIGCRTPFKGQAAVKELHDQDLTGCEVIEIDVTDDSSIAKAAAFVAHKFGRLDVLHVNGKGRPRTRKGHAPRRRVHVEDNHGHHMVHTNVAGAAQTVEAFTPLLSKADNPRVVFISSGLGSLTTHTKGGMSAKYPAYSASKAALIMMMLHYWRTFPGWKVNAACPGFRATALNHHGASEPSTTPGKLEDGAVNAVRLSLLGKDGESGTYTRRNDQSGEIVALQW